MPFTNDWPYTDLHNLNLDWLIQRVKALETTASPEAVEQLQQQVAQLIEDWNDLDPTVRAIIADYMANTYQLPIAAANTLGAVLIGSTISVDADGRINVDASQLPVASPSTPGIVRIGNGLYMSNGILGAFIGTGLAIDADGRVYATGQSVAVITPATYNVLGGVIVGGGLDVQNDGTISVKPATANDLGAVIVGNGLDVQLDGTVAVKPATTSTLGGVKTGNAATTHIAVDGNGEISATGLATASDLNTLSGTVSSNSSAISALQSADAKSVKNGNVGGEFNALFKASFNAQFTLQGDTLIISPVA